MAKAMVLIGAVGDASGVFSVLVAGILVLLAIAVLIVSYAASLTQANEAGTLGITGNDLVVTYGANRQIVAFADIVSALVVERRDSFENTFTCVDIETKHGDRMTFTARNAEDARTIIEAAGFGPGSRRQRATFATPARRLVHPVLAYLAYWAAFRLVDGTAFLELKLALLGGALYELTKRCLRPTLLVAGHDGVALRRALGTTFIPRRDIASVEAPSNAPPVIHHHDGARTTLRGLGWDAARLRAFARTIEDRLAVDETAADRAPDYDRHALPVAEWRKRLEGHSQHADYRSSPPTTDDALAVLRSPHATPDQRVGAALAVRGAGVPSERIRIAADATVDDRVRIALEAVADDEGDIAIERAMKRFSR